MNRHGSKPADFKSAVSTYSTTTADKLRTLTRVNPNQNALYWTRTNGDHALQPCVLPTELTKRRIQAQSLYPVTAKPLSNLTATSRRVGVEPTWQYAVFPLKRTPYRVIETIVFLPDLRTNCAGGSRTRIGLRLALAVKLPHSQVHTQVPERNSPQSSQLTAIRQERSRTSLRAFGAFP